MILNNTHNGLKATGSQNHVLVGPTELLCQILVSWGTSSKGSSLDWIFSMICAYAEYMAQTPCLLSSSAGVHLLV